MKKYFFLSLLVIESAYCCSATYTQEGPSENAQIDIAPQENPQNSLLKSIDSKNINNFLEIALDYIKRHPDLLDSLVAKLLPVLLKDEKKEPQVAKRQEERAQGLPKKTHKERELEWLKNRREGQKHYTQHIRSSLKERSEFQYYIGDIENSALIFQFMSHPSRHDSRYLVQKLLPILKKYMEKYPQALSVVITDKPRSLLNSDEKALTFSSWIWSQPDAKEVFLKAFLCSDEEFESLYAQAKETENPEMRGKLAAFYERLEEQDGSGGWVRDPISILYELNDALEIAGLPLIEVNAV